MSFIFAGITLVGFFLFVGVVAVAIGLGYYAAPTDEQLEEWKDAERF